MDHMELPYPNFLQKYSLRDHRNQDYLINDFTHIGWTDPFNHEYKDQQAVKAAKICQQNNQLRKIVIDGDTEELIYA